MVAVGFTLTLPPLTPPSTSIKSYESFVVFHVRVTGVPDVTEVEDAAKVLMVGGAPVTRQWAEEIGADGYARDAMGAVALAKRLLGTL